MTEIKDKYYKSTEKLLYNYNMLKASIENMQQEIKELKHDAVGASAINYETEKTGNTYKINHPTEKEAIKNITAVDLLKKRIEKTQSKIDRVDRAIAALSKKEREIIIKRYIESKQWYEVAYEVNYNERWCKEIRRKAINKLAIGLYGDTALLKHDLIEKIL